jgi:hypothetical protein
MTLHELEIGDKFIAINDRAKNPIKYIVKGSPMFNIRHGRPTRLCVKLPEGEIVSKSCGLEIKPIGESKHKAKMNNAITIKK